MASSKTVLRPLWVRAEHSRYFTESGVKQQESRGRDQGRFLGKTASQATQLRATWAVTQSRNVTSLCLSFLMFEMGSLNSVGGVKTHKSRSVSFLGT